MPLSAGGQLTIVASSDLGGLGPRAGAPVAYNWTVAGVAPLLLPWLAILGLLSLKSNRRAEAWWIWLPLACVVAFTLAPPQILPSGIDPLLDAVGALAIGLAAVWLLSDYLRQSRRLLTSVGALTVLVGFGALTFLTKQAWNPMSIEAVPAAIVLGVSVVATAIALELGGLICRNRCRLAGVYPVVLLLLIGIWLLAAAPLFLVAVVGSNAPLDWSEFFIPVLAVALGNFATLLPFLILSSASPLFRERLEALLHIGPGNQERLKAKG